jgi:signal transduction histidine kinase
VTQGTLTSKIASVQTRLTLVALLLVTLGTAGAVTATLTWKTDQQLESVLARVTPYLAGKSPANVDWQWLGSEISEVRPGDVRVEVRDSTGELRLAQGESQGQGRSAAGFVFGCRNYDEARACGRSEHGFQLSAVRSREDDFGARRYFVSALCLVSLVIGLFVALSSRAVTRRALQPFSELATRVAAIEPGTGRRVALHSNVLEVDSLAARFDGLVERFEQAIEREQRFTAEASHELRAPLTVALAEIEALARGTHDEKSAERAIDALAGVSSLAEALLLFARAQAKVSDERMAVVNLADVAREQVELVRTREPSTTFSVQLPDEALVRGDERLLSRAVANLLDNAIKYGDGSPIEVHADRSGETLSLSVSNGGRGIPPSLRAQIFEPFFRAPEDSGVRGFGLGLPFVRAVVRAHSGEVEVASPRADRTSFILRLPLLEWTEAAATG